jgi:flagellar basal body-associated protein FliL
MTESQEALFKDLEGLASTFDEHIKKLSVKEMVKVHESHIAAAKKVSTSADNKKRKAELEKLQEEVKRVIKKYEAKIKGGGKVDSKDLQAIKDMNAKLRGENAKLAQELKDHDAKEAKVTPAPSPVSETKAGVTATADPTSTSTPVTATEDKKEPPKSQTTMFIIIGLVAVVAIGAVLFFVMQPPPPPPPKSFFKKEELKDDKKWFAPVKEPEPESSMLIPIVVVVLCLAAGGGFFAMQAGKKTVNPGTPGGLGLVREDDAIKGSKRIQGSKKKNYAGQDDDDGAQKDDE